MQLSGRKGRGQQTKERKYRGWINIPGHGITTHCVKAVNKPDAAAKIKADFPTAEVGWIQLAT